MSVVALVRRPFWGGRGGGGVSRWVVIENRLALALLLRFVGLLLIVIVFGMFMTFALNFLAGML